MMPAFGAVHCLNCGDRFFAEHPDERFCGDDCAEDWLTPGGGAA